MPRSARTEDVLQPRFSGLGTARPAGPPVHARVRGDVAAGIPATAGTTSPGNWERTRHGSTMPTQAPTGPHLHAGAPQPVGIRPDSRRVTCSSGGRPAVGRCHGTSLGHHSSVSGATCCRGGQLTPQAGLWVRQGCDGAWGPSPIDGSAGRVRLAVEAATVRRWTFGAEDAVPDVAATRCHPQNKQNAADHRGPDPFEPVWAAGGLGGPPDSCGGSDRHWTAGWAALSTHQAVRDPESGDRVAGAAPRTGRQLRQDVPQIHPRVDPVSPRRGGHTQQDGRRPEPTVPTQGQPVLATDTERSDGLFGHRVVDGQPPVGEMHAEGSRDGPVRSSGPRGRGRRGRSSG